MSAHFSFDVRESLVMRRLVRLGLRCRGYVDASIVNGHVDAVNIWKELCNVDL